MNEEIFRSHHRIWGILFQTMVNVLNSTLLAILIAEFVIGKVGNSFIVLVNCIDWVKRRKISPMDRILTALAASRIGLLWVILINSYIYIFYLEMFMTEKMLMMIFIFWIVNNHFSLWLATSLSICYFLKIANFSNSIFLYLKWRVEKVVSLTLLVTLVFLILNIALVIISGLSWFGEHKSNMTASHSKMRDFVQFSNQLVFITTMFTLVPFVVSLVVFLLLIFSLGKHLRRVQLNAKGSRDASTKAHITALQSVIAFLLLYAVFSLSLFTSFWSSDPQEKNLVTMFCQAVGSVYPSGHPYVLILANSKLRQAFHSVWGWLRCNFKEGGVSSP